MYSDLVRVSDSGRIRLNSKDVYFWGDEKSVVEVKGWVRTLCRERGKIVPGSRREGHNVWTNTGREFLSMLMSYDPTGLKSYRNDRIGFIGVGTGIQTEDPGVVTLQNPIPYAGSVFLAPIDHTATAFPLSPTRTTVRFTHVFGEDQITFGPTTSVLVSELGLFTDGDQFSFKSGERATGINDARIQSPTAYKSLPEPIEKTSALELQVEWEIRL